MWTKEKHAEYSRNWRKNHPDYYRKYDCGEKPEKPIMLRKYTKREPKPKPPQRVTFRCLWCNCEAETTIPAGLSPSIVQITPLFCDQKCEQKWRSRTKQIEAINEQMRKSQTVYECSVCHLRILGVRGKKVCPNPKCLGKIISKVVPI